MCNDCNHSFVVYCSAWCGLTEAVTAQYIGDKEYAYMDWDYCLGLTTTGKCSYIKYCIDTCIHRYMYMHRYMHA